MAKEETLIRVTCCYEECGKPFNLRVESHNPAEEEEGKAQVGVSCPYCGQTVMVPLEKKYIEPGVMTRTVKGTVPD